MYKLYNHKTLNFMIPSDVRRHLGSKAVH